METNFGAFVPDSLQKTLVLDATGLKHGPIPGGRMAPAAPLTLRPRSWSRPVECRKLLRTADASPGYQQRCPPGIPLTVLALKSQSNSNMLAKVLQLNPTPTQPGA